MVVSVPRVGLERRMRSIVRDLDLDLVRSLTLKLDLDLEEIFFFREYYEYSLFGGGGVSGGGGDWDQLLILTRFFSFVNARNTHFVPCSVFYTSFDLEKITASAGQFVIPGNNQVSVSMRVEVCFSRKHTLFFFFFFWGGGGGGIIFGQMLMADWVAH